MEEKGLGRALNPIEPISVFFDPRRKRMSEDDYIGDGNVLQTMATSDNEELGHRFVGGVTHYYSRTPAPVPAPAPAPAPASGLTTPAATWPRVFSVME